jgi:hypothetical protein
MVLLHFFSWARCMAVLASLFDWLLHTNRQGWHAEGSKPALRAARALGPPRSHERHTGSARRRYPGLASASAAAVEMHCAKPPHTSAPRHAIPGPIWPPPLGPPYQLPPSLLVLASAQPVRTVLSGRVAAMAEVGALLAGQTAIEGCRETKTTGSWGGAAPPPPPRAGQLLCRQARQHGHGFIQGKGG